VRKALELPLALWIDLVIPKRRQIEVYLNIVEWGPGGEFGAEAAARRAFRKPASSLSPQQAAMMAAILPNPLRRDPAKPSPRLHQLASVIAARASSEGNDEQCIRVAARVKALGLTVPITLLGRADEAVEWLNNHKIVSLQ
jgi:monofunctional glycosyltransferase